MKNINNMTLNELYGQWTLTNFIIIKELFASKNTLKEAKKQNCNYILNKNGKLSRLNNV